MHARFLVYVQQHLCSWYSVFPNESDEGSPLQVKHFLSPPPRKSPIRFLFPSPTKSSFPLLNNNLRVINQKNVIFSCSHCTCTSLYTQVMLIWILINVRYLQNVVFSFEKDSNGHNHSSGFHHRINKSLLHNFSSIP